jgi:hypothetical protein
MSGFATASTGTFTTSDGCSIVYTLYAASLSGGGESRPRITLIHSLALPTGRWR